MVAAMLTLHGCGSPNVFKVQLLLQKLALSYRWASTFQLVRIGAEQYL